VTTRRFFIAAQAVAAGMLLVGLAAAFQSLAAGVAIILLAAAVSAWAFASYRRKLWAWRITLAFCFGVFLVATVLMASLPVAYVLGFGVKGKLLIAVAAGSLIVLGGYAFTFRQALRELYRERGAFDSASALERTLGRPAW
jgi:hypothetical protein